MDICDLKKKGMDIHREGLVPTKGSQVGVVLLSTKFPIKFGEDIMYSMLPNTNIRGNLDFDKD